MAARLVVRNQSMRSVEAEKTAAWARITVAGGTARLLASWLFTWVEGKQVVNELHYTMLVVQYPQPALLVT